MKTSMIKNNLGLTIVEVLVGLGIAVTAGSAVTMGLIQAQNQTKKTTETDVTDKQILEIAENIRIAPETYQVTFDYTGDAADRLLNPTSLPMAWDKNKSVPVAECPDCPGRYGYIVQPFENYRGLYLVTLRLTHKSWKDTYREHQFVVSPK